MPVRLFLLIVGQQKLAVKLECLQVRDTYHMSFTIILCHSVEHWHLTDWFSVSVILDKSISAKKKYNYQ